MLIKRAINPTAVAFKKTFWGTKKEENFGLIGNTRRL